jgi:hypothetical protein
MMCEKRRQSEERNERRVVLLVKEAKNKVSS